MKRLIFVMLWLTQAYSSSALAYERFEEDGKMGIRDEQGHVVVPPAFEALGWSDGSFSLLGEITGYRKGNRWGLLNLKKEFITKAEYLTLTSAGGNYVRVSREISAVATKVGCISLKGEVVIPMIYDDLYLHDLRAVVMVKDGARYKHGLVDLSNREVLPAEFRDITPLGSLRYAIRNFDGKTALFSEEGKWVTGFDIDSLSQFQFDLAIIYKGLHRGIIDRAGSARVDPTFKAVRIVDAGQVQLKQPDRWKIIDHEQRILRQTEADEIGLLGANCYRLTLNRKSGIVDSTFKVIIPVTFDFVGPVENNLFVVGDAGRFGLMRTDGMIILPIRYDTLIRDGRLLRARITELGRAGWDLFDTVGVRKTQTSYDQIGEPANALYPVSQKGFAGALDQMGVEAIACAYDSLLEITDNAVTVKFKGLYGIVSRDDVWKVLPQPLRVAQVSPDRFMEVNGALKTIKDFNGEIIYFTDNPLTVEGDHFLERLPDGTEKTVGLNGVEWARHSPAWEANESVTPGEHEGLTLIRKDGKYGFVDNRGRLRIANRYEAAGNFREGLAPVRLLGKWGFIDKSDQIVVQPTYDREPVLENGAAVVARNGKSGIIDREGDVRLDLRYDSIRKLDLRTFLLHQKGLKGLADGGGRILLEPRFDSIVPIANDQVIVSQGGRYGLLTREGLSVFPLSYELLIYQPATRTFFVRETFDWENRTLK